MRLPVKPPLIPKDFNFSESLDKLLESGHLLEFFEIADAKYYYYDKWKHKAKEWGLDPKILWGIVKTRRHANPKLKISNVERFSFTLSSSSIIQQYLHEFDLNLGGSLQGDSIIPTEDRDRYLISSLMEEAIASSQLEGAATTRKIAKEMLEKNRRPRNQGEQMILNNYEAMKWIVSNKDAAITVKSIKHLHAILTKLTLTTEDDEGAFRKDDDIKVIDVQTGNAVYTPPGAEYLDQLMSDFCIFANDQEKKTFFLHPINKGIILHFLIGYIHPFVDGNGRTARTIFYWYLIKKEYWLTEYMSISRVILNSKAQYSRAYLYTEQDDNDLTYFLIYNLRCIHLALEGLKIYIRRKSAEKQNAITILRNTNLNDRQIVLAQEIIQDPTIYFTVKQIETKFGISNQTARNDLNGLVAAGALEERRAGKKSQYLPVKGFMKKFVSRDT
jgi:Fic family protein